MKRYKTLALSTAAVLGILVSGAQAQQANFTSHHLVPAEDYAPYAAQLDARSKLELRDYLDYEFREPCQNYQLPPHGFVRKDCELYVLRKEEKHVIKKVERRTMQLRPVIQDYMVYFDFDRANIRVSEEATLSRVADEIQKYQPYEVTIVGHTDRSGPSDYNMALSKRRAQAVSDALTARGIQNRILDEAAMGESDPAVPTQDGVKLQENRRVEIQFRK